MDVFACLSTGIPEDPLTAEAYYHEDGFDSCSEEDEEEDEVEENEEEMKDEDEDGGESEAYDTFCHTYGQVGHVRLLVKH